MLELLLRRFNIVKVSCLHLLATQASEKVQIENRIQHHFRRNVRDREEIQVETH